MYTTIRAEKDELSWAITADRLQAWLCRLSCNELRTLQQGIANRLVEVDTNMQSADEVPSGSYGGVLTPRETEVLTLIASGYTRREVGEVLSITQNTAATHIASLYRKLEINSIAEATIVAIRRGLVN